MVREKGVAVLGDDENGGVVVVGRQEHELLLGAKLRRGIATGKRGGLCTPVPSWKLGAGPSGGGGDNPANRGAAGRATVSARKLGANLWEIQELLPVVAEMRRGGGRVRHHKEEKGMNLDPQSPEDGPRTAGSLRRHAAASLIQRQKTTHMNDRSLQHASPGSCSSSMEVAAHDQAMTPARSFDLREKLTDSGYSLKTSTELLKVLNRIWSLEEQNASNVSLVKALKLELAHARARVHELLREQQADHRKIDELVRQIADDKLGRKSKERERVRAAVQSVKDELEDEKRLRRHSESLHQSLAKELSEVKSAYSKALKNIEKERKENALLSNLCDEFAKGIGDYEHEVRQLKHKSEKDFSPRCDRLVLHISEAWLDERLQLKLAEGRGNFTERDSIIERLGCEVEAFVRAKRTNSAVGIVVQRDAGDNKYLHRQSLESFYLNGAVSAPQDADDEDSVASDLHCFELNMGREAKEASDRGAEKSEARFSGSAKKRNLCLERIRGHGSPSIMSKQLGKHEDTTSHGKGKDMLSTDNDIIHACCSPDSKGVHKFEASKAALDEARESRDDSNSGWDGIHHLNHSNDDSAKGQLNFKIHPENVDVDINSASDLARSKGKSIAVEAVGHLGDNQHGSTLVQHGNFCHAYPKTEITDSALELPWGVRENTLKARLIEARLEGRQAHLRMSKGLSEGG